MDFKAIYSVVEDDFAAVNDFIHRHLDSNVPLVREVGNYIVDSGGKRLRPLVAILCARACGYTGDKHINVAAIIEFLHTATLLHDDVVDESSLRRGRPTVNAVWGNSASVLVGDFLISRSFQLVVEVGDYRLMNILANSTNIISEGEVLQLINCRDPDTTEERYMQVIHHKTAKMFESAAETGSVIGVEDDQLAQQRQKTYGDFGRHLGIAFQLIDDVLDYQGDVSELGKNIGDDLAEGKPTLPLIYTMRHGSGEQAKLIREAIRTGGLEHLEEIITTVQNSGGLEYTIEQARKHTERALSALASTPDNRYKESLLRLARESLERTW
jgi:octaprenyl-diphosphate synthase